VTLVLDVLLLLVTCALALALVGEAAVETSTLALVGATTTAFADEFGVLFCESVVFVEGGGTRTVPWPEPLPLQ